MYGENTKYHNDLYIQGTTVPCDIGATGLSRSQVMLYNPYTVEVNCWTGYYDLYDPYAVGESGHRWCQSSFAIMLLACPV